MISDAGNLTRRLGLILAASIFCAAAGLAQPRPQGPPLSPPKKKIAFPLVTPRPVETVVAQTRRGPITIQDIQQFVMFNKDWELGPYNALSIPAFPADRLQALAQHVAGLREATAEVDARKDPKLVETLTKEMKATIDQLAYMNVTKQEIMDKVSAPSEAEIKAMYDKHIAEFKVPFNFSMRHMLLLTYEPYVVQASDLTQPEDKSLERIAARLCGDPHQADNIRYDVAGRPARREAGKVFKPLEIGERLLIPMKPAQAEQVRRRLELLLSEMKSKGMTFAELVVKFSQADDKGEIGPLPSGTRPILPRFLELGKTTPAGGITPIFQTRHGFQVIQVTRKEDEHTLALSAPGMQENIVKTIRKEKTDALFQALTDKIFSNPRLKINYEVFAKASNAPTSNTVVATVGEAKIFWGPEVEKAWEERGRSNAKEVIDLQMRKTPDFYLPLVYDYARPMLNDKNSTLSRQIELLRVSTIGNNRQRERGSADLRKQITPQMLSEQYVKNKERFKTPVQVKYDSMVMALEPKDIELQGKVRDEALAQLVERMQQQLARVNSRSAFVDLAARINEPLTQRNVPIEKSEKAIPLAQVPEAVQQHLTNLEAGHWSPPVIMPDRVRVISFIVTERTKESYLKQEEVKPYLTGLIFEEQQTAVLSAIEADYAKQAGFEFVLQPKS